MCIEHYKQKVKEEKMTLVDLAKAMDLSRPTLMQIRDGTAKDFQNNTIKKLEAYFNPQPAPPVPFDAIVHFETLFSLARQKARVVEAREEYMKQHGHVTLVEPVTAWEEVEARKKFQV